MNQRYFYSFCHPLKHNLGGNVHGRETDVPCEGKVCSGGG